MLVCWCYCNNWMPFMRIFLESHHPWLRNYHSKMWQMVVHQRWMLLGQVWRFSSHMAGKAGELKYDKECNTFMEILARRPSSILIDGWIACQHHYPIFISPRIIIITATAASTTATWPNRIWKDGQQLVCAYVALHRWIEFSSHTIYILRIWALNCPSRTHPCRFCCFWLSKVKCYVILPWYPQQHHRQSPTVVPWNHAHLRLAAAEEAVWIGRE